MFRSLIVFAAFAVGTLLPVGGIDGPARPFPLHPEPALGVDSPETVAERLQDTVVEVHIQRHGDGAYSMNGSGVLIQASDGSQWVWTCAHVLDRTRQADGTYPQVLITGNDQARVPGTVVRMGSREGIDVALIQVQGRVAGTSGRFAAQAPRVGTSVFVVGAPRGEIDTVTGGVVSFIGLQDGEGSPVFDQTSAPSDHGNSGGPVARQDNGQVLGIVSRGLSNTLVRYVPAWVMRDFARRTGVEFAFDTSLPVVAVEGPVDR